jgi:hypothetical protein
MQNHVKSRKKNVFFISSINVIIQNIKKNNKTFVILYDIKKEQRKVNILKSKLKSFDFKICFTVEKFLGLNDLTDTALLVPLHAIEETNINFYKQILINNNLSNVLIYCLIEDIDDNFTNKSIIIKLKERKNVTLLVISFTIVAICCFLLFFYKKQIAILAKYIYNALRHKKKLSENILINKMLIQNKEDLLPLIRTAYNKLRKSGVINHPSKKNFLLHPLLKVIKFFFDHLI